MNSRPLLNSLAAAMEQGRKSYRISDSENQSSNAEEDKEGEETRRDVLEDFKSFNNLNLFMVTG